MKKVIVTGAGGFIGRQSISYLASRGFEVHGITSKGSRCGPDPIIWHKGDLLKDDDTGQIIREVRPSHLLHFAWYTEPGQYWSSGKNLEWLQSSLNLLRHFRLHGGERAVIAGTCAEYDWTEGYCDELTTPLNPGTLYGKSKNQLRQSAESYCRNEGLSFSWGRIFFLFGPLEHRSRLVPSVILSLLKGNVARCTHGRQLRDYMYSEDVASAFATLLDSDVDGPVNIASGKAVSIRSIIDSICEKMGMPGMADFGAIPAPADEPPRIVASARRLNQEVGWKPRFGIDRGLDETIEWWRGNGEQ